MNLNQKDKLKNGHILPLMESFLSIQGEGYFAGKSSYFLRIGGCDVGCHWCDVKESWDPKIHPLTEVDKIIKEVQEFGSIEGLFANTRTVKMIKITYLYILHLSQEPICPDAPITKILSCKRFFLQI